MELWQNEKVEFYHMLMKQYLFPAFCPLLLIFLLAHSAFAEIPPSFTAIYTLYYDDLRVGVMERRFIHNGDSAGVFESNGKLTGLAAMFRKDRISESSHWEVNNGAIRPVEYRYERTGSKKVKKEYHRFDWSKNKVTSTTQDGTKEQRIKPGLLDKLLYQLPMMDIKDPDKGLKFELIDGTTLKTYYFEFMDKEDLSTPMGKLQTLKFQRTRPDNKKSKRSTVLWCAPSLNYLPVRVDNIDKKGHLTSIVIKEFSEL